MNSYYQDLYENHIKKTNDKTGGYVNISLFQKLKAEESTREMRKFG
jgi:hypothetical protein